MNQNRRIAHALLAATTASALAVSSASLAVAKGKPQSASTKPDRLVSVSIKGHDTIDLTTTGTSIALRAKVLDPQKDGGPSISVTLGLYTKKVGGAMFQVNNADAPLSVATSLTAATGTSKVRKYTGTAALSTVWTADQLAAVADELTPGEKAYVCISSVTTDPDGISKSVQVKKRLGEGKGKAVRDCVKVIDSTP
jgi:uncharacterized membrane protein